MTETILAAVLYIYLGTVMISMVRIIIGPTSVDRMIGLNMVSAQVLAMLVLFAVKRNHPVYLDVALVYDIFGFIGVLAITKYFADKETFKR